jgi:hypothetical protein
VAGYGGVVLEGQARSAARDGDGFVVEIDTGRRVRGRRPLVTGSRQAGTAYRSPHPSSEDTP